MVRGRANLVGIVSFGYKCGSPSSVAVYARVSTIVPWLRQLQKHYDEDLWKNDYEFDFLQHLSNLRQTLSKFAKFLLNDQSIV